MWPSRRAEWWDEGLLITRNGQFHFHVRQSFEWAVEGFLRILWLLSRLSSTKKASSFVFLYTDTQTFDEGNCRRMNTLYSLTKVAEPPPALRRSENSYGYLFWCSGLFRSRQEPQRWPIYFGVDHHDQLSFFFALFFFLPFVLLCVCRK